MRRSGGLVEITLAGYIVVGPGGLEQLASRHSETSIRCAGGGGEVGRGAAAGKGRGLGA
jgi:hypothetical protein